MSTRYSVLGEVGDLAATPGSREWAVAVRLRIHAALSSVKGESQHIESMIGLMREHRGYRSLTDSRGRPFATYEGFCCERQPFGLGYRPADIDRIIGERKAREAKDRAEAALPLMPNGGDRKSRDQLDVIKLIASAPISGGTSADYLAARIARDRPDILDRMKAGEYPSVRAAALDAGIVKRTATIPLDPTRAARIIVKHFTPEAARTLAAELLRLAEPLQDER